MTAKIITLSGGSRAVEVGFNKSISDGVQISSRRGNETQFTPLASDRFAPYIDNRPNLGPGPETRSYKAVYLVGDDPVGNESPIISITMPASAGPT